MEVKNSIFIIIQNIIKQIKNFIFPIVILLLNISKLEEMGIPRYLVFSLVFMIIVLIEFLQWKKTVMYINDNNIVVHEGVFVKKERDISFDKIKTINYNQGIIFKVFKLSLLKIDTGASSLDKKVSNQSEIEILTTVDKALIIKDLINSKSANNIVESEEISLSNKKDYGNNNINYNISNNDLIKMSLTSNWFYTLFTVPFWLFAFLDDISDFVSSDISSRVSPEKIFKESSFSIFIIVAILGILMVLSLIAITSVYIKYYKFKLVRKDNYINISYGLINTKSYYIEVKNIKAVYKKQSLIRRILKLYSLNVEIIGYGDEKGEESILIPIVSKRSLINLTSKILPEYQIYFEELIKPPKRSIRRFMFLPCLIVIINSILSTIFVPFGFFSFSILVIVILISYQSYKNMAISVDNEFVSIYYGVINIKNIIVKLKDIEDIVIKESIFQKRAKLFDILLSFHSNSINSIHIVKNLSVENKLLIVEKVFPNLYHQK